MDVGIGLPNAVPDTTGEQLVEWARRADQRGFSILGTIDRIAYGNYEPMAALAAAAAVTERIGLATSVMLAPLRHNATLLAKQALSLNALSDGRFTLGLAVGGREDDYELSGLEMRGRGRKLDQMLERMQEIWAGEDVGPQHAGPPRVVVGGHSDVSFKRAARFGEGWIAGGAPPDQYAQMVEQVKAAWTEAGRDGEPRLMGLAYYSLGDGAEENARRYLLDYYAFLGDMAEQIAASAAKDAETVQQYLQAFEGAGCGELIMFPCSSDPGQVDLLAEAVNI
jgi:alkanesulfonate monooxygenase SsuD/methylene tetrahydromethanopterin reductase-like flavin-dependent oxidoreductase (luciferase family)